MSEEIDIIGEINQHLEREPFEPFIVVMASGDRYAIEDPNGATVGRRTIAIVPPRSEGHKLLRISPISSVEFSGT